MNVIYLGAAMPTGDSGGGSIPIIPAHNSLPGRDVANGHSIGAITGLTAELAGKAPQATTYTKTEVDALISTTFEYKGTKTTVAELPTTGNGVGDVWNVLEDSTNYAWNGTVWGVLGGVVDLSNYVTKGEYNPFDGTQAEWDALTPEEQAKYTLAYIY